MIVGSFLSVTLLAATLSVEVRRVTRRDGETVGLFVNSERPIDDFYSDWTATHEFSHLMLPLLSQRYRWISEGFASYFQNILMSRAGRYQLAVKSLAATMTPSWSQ